MAYVNRLAIHPSEPPSIFEGFVGALDGAGRATARIHVPGEPLLAGFTFHVAFLTLRPGAPSEIGAISPPLPPLDFGPEPGLSAGDIHRRILVCHRWGQRAEQTLAWYLQEMHRRRLHEQMGFSDIFHYAHVSLGVERRRGRVLLRLAETLERLPRVAEAFEEGRIGWTKVREIAPVTRPENEEEWLEKALTLTSRELEQAVVRAGGKPPRPALEAEVVAGPGGEEVELRLRLPVTVFALWEDALRKTQEVGGGKVSPVEGFEYLCREFLDTSWREEDRSNPYALAYYVCKKCHRTEVMTRDGALEVPPADVARACCDATAVDLEEEESPRPAPMTPIPDGPGEIEELAREEMDLVVATVASELEQRSFQRRLRIVPRALRRFLVYRDRGRCQVPGCGRRLGLEAHHIIYFARGGLTVGWNLVLVCGTHHRLIHEGWLRASGEAPDGLLWTGRDGTPLTHVGRLGPILERERALRRRSAALLARLGRPTWDGAGAALPLVRERLAMTG